jgi:hypothetical protein
MGRRRREGNYTPKKTKKQANKQKPPNLIDNVVGNEENGYPVPDPTKQ